MDRELGKIFNVPDDADVEAERIRIEKELRMAADNDNKVKTANTEIEKENKEIEEENKKKKEGEEKKELLPTISEARIKLEEVEQAMQKSVSATTASTDVIDGQESYLKSHSLTLFPTGQHNNLRTTLIDFEESLKRKRQSEKNERVDCRKKWGLRRGVKWLQRNPEFCTSDERWALETKHSESYFLSEEEKQNDHDITPWSSGSSEESNLNVSLLNEMVGNAY
jgi:hypothetical protein